MHQRVHGLAAHLGREEPAGDESGLAEPALKLGGLSAAEWKVVLRVAEVSAIVSAPNEKGLRHHALLLKRGGLKQ